MSYCRFSSDKHKSDIYVYHNINGKFYIHLSGDKHKEIENKRISPFPDTFVRKTLSGTLDMLIVLKRKYKVHVPKSAIKRLRKEIRLEKRRMLL